MKVDGLKVVGPVFDHSGYGSACRSNILALYRKGFRVCVEPVCFDKVQTNIEDSENRKIIDDLIQLTRSGMEYNTVLCQLTPDMALQHSVPGKYNIAYFAWETTKVHPKWVECLNNMDEVWVPSEFNVVALKESGVKTPTFKVPHGINADRFDNVDDTPVIPGLEEDTFKFYSVFQWQPRKNPEGLIRSYFSTFSSEEDVVLVIKTYLSGSLGQEKEFFQARINEIRKDMMLKSYPRVLLVSDILSDAMMKRLHKSMDCYVSLFHSEGWGLPPFEAGMAGNPVIATGETGNMEFMNEENSYPIRAVWGYVRSMSMFNPWYIGSGMWAMPDEKHASELMRYAFENREEVINKGQKLKEYIVNNFTYEHIARIMIDRLEKINV